MDLGENFRKIKKQAKYIGKMYRFSNAGTAYAVSVYFPDTDSLLLEKLQNELQKLENKKESAKNSMTFSDYLLGKTRTFAQEEYNAVGENLINSFRKYGAYTLDPDTEKNIEL